MQSPRHIALLSYEQANVVDITGPLQVFTSGNVWLKDRGHPGYRCRVLSLRGGAVTTSSGLPLVTEPLSAIADDMIDTLIVPGGPGAESEDAKALAPWILDRHPHLRRLCSVCTGAFPLAETGLLDGLRVVTHWMYAPRLQALYPRLNVEQDPIYIRQGKLWTSAGVTAGIDMALALLEEDYGHAASIYAARQMVVFLKRPGGQSQFSVPLATQSALAERSFDALHTWISEHLDEPLSIERLAEWMCMSPRTFARRYVEAIGQTPARTVERMRVEAASQWLESSAMPLKQIAVRCGFTSDQNLRRAFLRQFGVGPLDYRERFAPPATSG
ncbi:GlxA family transcriptional regulator [Mangrovitalea sediminis]|uniref:GlxA family transcriptional regulator n=1 Tax=Mangrovitalea sediminis TaxID=1982043 RepID=UPI000BE4E575|nr:GlxA family transcriptional regulator [Mangrovitalea sediminis]